MKKLFRRMDLHDGESLYMRRWSLSLPFGWTLKLHHIMRPDGDACQHDHPWWFITLILRGGYVEEVGEEKRVQRMRVGRIGYRPALYRHKITELPTGSAWTLVLAGPRVRDWGFHSPDGRFTPWQPFVNSERWVRRAWCEDEAV